MEFTVPTPEQGIHGLRAMKTIALADGELDASELAMLRAGREFCGIDDDPAELPEIAPAELAAAVTDPQVRWQLVQAMVVMSAIDQQPDQREIELIEHFATALEVDSFAINTAKKLSKGQNRRARLTVLRRFWAIDKIREHIRERGLGVLWRSVQGFRGTWQDEAVAERYRALGQLPEGTLGRVYHDSMRRDGFPLPGELGCAPEAITYHDMTHILGGYGTESAEEVLVACFSAGFRRENPMAFVLFVLGQFHLGVQMAPGRVVQPERGLFNPRTALAAIRRGAAMNVDLTSGWEYWDVIDQPVETLRARYNIAPRVR